MDVLNTAVGFWAIRKALVATSRFGRMVTSPLQLDSNCPTRVSPSKVRFLVFLDPKWNRASETSQRWIWERAVEIPWRAVVYRLNKATRKQQKQAGSLCWLFLQR